MRHHTRSLAGAGKADICSLYVFRSFCIAGIALETRFKLSATFTNKMSCLHPTMSHYHSSKLASPLGIHRLLCYPTTEFHAHRLNANPLLSRQLWYGNIKMKNCPLSVASPSHLTKARLNDFILLKTLQPSIMTGLGETVLRNGI